MSLVQKQISVSFAQLSIVFEQDICKNYECVDPTLIKSECDQLRVSILSVRDTGEKVISRACIPPWKLSQSSQIVEIRFFRRFQGTIILGTNHLPAGVLSKNFTFYRNVRPFSYFHISWKSELGLKFQASGKEAYD